MTRGLDELVNLLALEQIEQNLFRGQSKDPGWGVLYGGHVLGQALSAATQTVPAERRVHSLHAYFLRPGDVTKPVVYEVDRIRDGKSFTTRRVVAIQSGEPIFNMSASFQTPEDSFDHQASMPDVPPPEDLENDQVRLARFGDRLPKWGQANLRLEQPIDIRTVDADDPIAPTQREPRRAIWFRAVDKLPDDPALHANLFAYASDHGFVTTSLIPHGVSWMGQDVQVASIDHIIWFHRPFRFDEWLLYAMDSPNAFGARGLASGSVYTRDGLLVASTAQEGLIRRRKPKPAT